MSVDLKTYFDKQFDGLKEEVKEFRVEVRGQIEGLPCVEHKTVITQNTQRLNNGATEKKYRLQWWQIFISVVALAILAVELVDKLK